MKHTLIKLDRPLESSTVEADIMRIGCKLTYHQKLETTNISLILHNEAGNTINHYILQLDGNATIYLRNELNEIIKDWIR